jgi:hypothetical protein
MQGFSSQLAADGPVLLAWGTARVLDVRVSGQVPRRTGNVLYFIPLAMKIQGVVAFEGDLIRNSVVSVEGQIFAKDPTVINMGRGTVTVAYRPVAFDGALRPQRLVLALNAGGGDSVGMEAAKAMAPADPQPCRNAADDEPDCAKPPKAPDLCDPATQDCSQFINPVPEIELFDTTGGGRWLRLPAFTSGNAYEIQDPRRYVDPASGTVLVRFVNDKNEGMGFGFQVRIDGTVG